MRCSGRCSRCCTKWRITPRARKVCGADLEVEREDNSEDPAELETLIEGDDVRVM